MAGADRGLVVDGMLAAPGKTAKWAREARSGAWRWKRESSAGLIDSASLAPVAAQGGRVRVDIRGRLIADSAVAGLSKGVHAGRLSIDWAGAKPVTTEVAVAFPECTTRGAGDRAPYACTGRAVK